MGMGLLEMSERTPVGHLVELVTPTDIAAYLQIFERRGDTLHVHAADPDKTIVATVTFQEPNSFNGVCGMVETSEQSTQGLIGSGNRIVATIRQEHEEGSTTFTVFAVNGKDVLGVVRPTKKSGYQFEAETVGGETLYIRTGGYTYIPDNVKNGDIYLAQKAAQDAAGMGAAFFACFA